MRNMLITMFAGLRTRDFMKTDYVEHCVGEHGKRIIDVMNEKQIAIDGEKVCGIAPRLAGPKGNYLLHAWAT